MSGSSQLTLELSDIVINGTNYPLLTSTYEVKSKGEGGSTARKAVGGTGLGALIGGIAGGGKRAGIGALVGAGAGTTVSAAGKGQQLQIPTESLLEFRLEQPCRCRWLTDSSLIAASNPMCRSRRSIGCLESGR